MDDVTGTGHLLPDGRRLVVGGALVRERDGVLQLLAARRVEPPELAGGWELPGGKVEPGETEAEALRRELREELGVAADALEAVPGPDAGGWPLGSDYLMRVHLVHAWQGDPAPLEQHDAVRWIGLEGWRSLPWLDGDVAPVTAVAAALAGRGSAPTASA